MNENLAKMNAIPVVEETTVAASHCAGCGNPAVHKLAFRVSDTQQQSMSWCNRCAGEVLNFLEARVLRVKSEG